MDTKSKIFYASSTLIPTVAESLRMQLELNYKVKMENRLGNDIELTVVKDEYNAWKGRKLLKRITLSSTPNGQIVCQVAGMGWSGLIMPLIIVVVAFVFSPLTAGVTLAFLIIMVYSIIKGIKEKKALTNEIFQLTQEAIEAGKNIAAEQNIEKTCPQCGTIVHGAGFCPECGTKIN